ncbi:MAG: hypothetical protein PHH58_10135 [Rhodoferax sp.]|nr:hypothetical protein [Rhodoferax sp.]
MTDQAKTSLGQVAKALQGRPALKMTAVGSASLSAERDAYQRAQLLALVQGEQRRTAGSAGPGGTQSLLVTPQQHSALLKAVYRRADIPKPRNLIGLDKDLSVAEMEALLRSHLDASEAARQALALQRGVAVRLPGRTETAHGASVSGRCKNSHAQCQLAAAGRAQFGCAAMFAQ